MSTRVQTRIVKIGNSRGVRIPQLLLQHLGTSGEVEIEAKAGQLVLRPVANAARVGWEAKFAKMAARGDDALLDEETLTASSWDEEEWQW